MMIYDRLRKAGGVAVLLFVACTHDSAVVTCEDPRVQTHLEEFSKESATAHVECHEIAQTDLDGDGAREAVLQISYEGAGGGNNSGSTLFLLPSNPAEHLIQEPDEPRGSIASVEVVDREIRMHTLEHRDSDPRCCPSGAGEVRLRLKDNRLLRSEPGA